VAKWPIQAEPTQTERQDVLLTRSNEELPSAFEAHHLLYDALTLFGNFTLFANAVGAILTNFAKFPANFYGY
jgi:hypothetical protein